MNAPWQTLYHGGCIATMRPDTGPYGLIADGAIAATNGKIVWIGPTDALPGEPETLAGHVQNLQGQLVTPGLIEIDTQLVHSADGADAFANRLAAGNAVDTAPPFMELVRANRTSEDEDLFEHATHRLSVGMREGLTTVEIKTGLTLDIEAELRTLRVIRALDYSYPPAIRAGCFAANAVPEDRAEADYVGDIVGPVLETALAEGIVDAVDLRAGGRAPRDVSRLIAAARDARLPLRLHTDRLEDGLDLLNASAPDAVHFAAGGPTACARLAASGATAALAPAVHLATHRPPPPLHHLKEAGIPVALTSGYRPDRAPTMSPLLVMALACHHWALSPEDALAGMTRHAATAIGLGDRLGTLELGKTADFAVWLLDSPDRLPFYMGHNPCCGVVKDGLPMIPIRIPPERPRRTRTARR